MVDERSNQIVNIAYIHKPYAICSKLSDVG